MIRPLARNLSLLALAAMGLLLLKAWKGATPPKAVEPSPPIRIDEVRVCPCYERLSTPSREELLANLNRVVSITDRLTEAYRAARSNTLLLRFVHFKVVIFPELAMIVEQNGKLPFLRRGNLITVRGLLVRHPRYGLEIILRRPEDLVVGITA